MKLPCPLPLRLSLMAAAYISCTTVALQHRSSDTCRWATHCLHVARVMKSIRRRSKIAPHRTLSLPETTTSHSLKALEHHNKSKTMGNTPSSSSIRSNQSAKFRTDRGRLDPKSRQSTAVSFYATPPGSLDLRELEQGTAGSSQSSRVEPSEEPGTPRTSNSALKEKATPVSSPTRSHRHSRAIETESPSPSEKVEHADHPAQREAMQIQIGAREENVKPVWQPGTYSLINAGSGSVIDLSGGDTSARSVIGFPAHHGPNQQVRTLNCWQILPNR